MKAKNEHSYIEPHGFMLTLLDGEEIVGDVSSKCVMKNIKIVDSGVFYVDYGGCDIVVDDVMDLDDEGHYDPYDWFKENASPFYE